MDVGKRIAYFREMRGYTVNKLANLSGISQSYLRDIENGKNTNPTVDVLRCICEAMDISLHVFFTESADNDLDNRICVAIQNLNRTQQRKLLEFIETIKP